VSDSRSALFRFDGSTSLDGGVAPACVLVVGNFDGVHRGHRAVIDAATAEARARGLVPAVLTFDPHPNAVVGSGAPPTLTTIERRAELLSEIGVGRVYVRRFDAELAQWPAERFVRELVLAQLRARVVFVGENFRFGAGRAGDFALLEREARAAGSEARTHALAHDAVGPFSSTRARRSLAEGDVAAAANVLGRPHAISGVVVHGAARGRTIGFPTANLSGIAELLPADGVYAVRVDVVDAHGARRMGDGVMNIGVRPTVGGEPTRSVEVYVLDFTGDLYDQALRVHVVDRLRGEQRFAGLDALKAQIVRDVEDARSALRA
jgi:riboflavin kinase / FMN adenylyltransferase